MYICYRWLIHAEISFGGTPEVITRTTLGNTVAAAKYGVTREWLDAKQKPKITFLAAQCLEVSFAFRTTGNWESVFDTADLVLLPAPEDFPFMQLVALS